MTEQWLCMQRVLFQFNFARLVDPPCHFLPTIHVEMPIEVKWLFLLAATGTIYHYYCGPRFILTGDGYSWTPQTHDAILILGDCISAYIRHDRLLWNSETPPDTELSVHTAPCCTLYFHMMTSSNGNIFRVTAHLCKEFTGDRWIPRTNASDAELWCLCDLPPNIRLSKQWWGWWFETP